MNLSVFPDARSANAAAVDRFVGWLGSPGMHRVMLAAGNTPLEFYRLAAERRLPSSHLQLFALDEYLGVPPDEPRNCANLIRRAAVEAWGVPEDRFFALSSQEMDALASVQRHEQRIADAGGLDIVVLGLGQNGHLGFNEPGSAPDSIGRVLDLDPISVEANRAWFGGDYAPARGVTTGMKTILAARRILLLAYGSHKAAPVQAMLEGPCTPRCPASLLQQHPNTIVFLDEAAAIALESEP